MSARTRKHFKTKIAPRIARSLKVRRVRLLVVVPQLCDETARDVCKRIHRVLEVYSPVPAKVSLLSQRTRIVEVERA